MSVAVGILMALWQATAIPTAPPVPAPEPVVVTPAEPGDDAAEGLPTAPRPYSEVGPQPTTPTARSRSAVDTPALPQRGMGGDAWGDSVRARSQAAQQRQGSLDGGWTVTDEAGAALFRLQMVDAPGGELEGVWREAERPGLLPASGLFASAAREGEQTVLTFEAPQGGGAAEIALSAGPTGWSGTLTVGGEARPIRLVRAATP